MTISYPQLKIVEGEEFVFVQPMCDVRFPHALLDGSSCQMWIPMLTFSQTLRERGHKKTIKLIATCKDKLGKEYRSKPFTVDLDGDYSKAP